MLEKLQPTQTKHVHSMHGSSAKHSWTSDAASSPGAAVGIEARPGKSKVVQAQQAERTLSQASRRICLSSAMRGYRGLAPAAGSGKQELTMMLRLQEIRKKRAMLYDASLFLVKYLQGPYY